MFVAWLAGGYASGRRCYGLYHLRKQDVSRFLVYTSLNFQPLSPHCCSKLPIPPTSQSSTPRSLPLALHITELIRNKLLALHSPHLFSYQHQSFSQLTPPPTSNTSLHPSHKDLPHSRLLYLHSHQLIPVYTSHRYSHHLHHHLYTLKTSTSLQLSPSLNPPLPLS